MNGDISGCFTLDIGCKVTRGDSGKLAKIRNNRDVMNSVIKR